MDNPIEPSGRRLMQILLINRKYFLRRDWRLVRNTLITLLLLCVMAFWCVGRTSAEWGLIEAHGTLTSVEAGDTVVINDGGYAMDSEVRIYNWRGKSCQLQDLQLPVPVSFTYVTTSKGPIIKRIREQPR